MCLTYPFPCRLWLSAQQLGTLDFTAGMNDVSLLSPYEFSPLIYRGLSINTNLIVKIKILNPSAGCKYFERNGDP